MYKFKEIQVVPGAKEFQDIVLSRTQRKTPTVVHPQFKISRIRSFYMRKVKYAQQTFNEKFSKILEDFPKIDDIHPFYADLCNVLYDRDHYKLALGQVNAVRGIVDNIGKDYAKLLKFSDTPYKCKMLKRAGLGRMCTAVKKLQASLVYLEEVRQHLARLPSINPSTRSLLITGYPNVGKSSFMNCISQANVEVQPYAFTTKSLYVGHFDFEYCRWQVIDTPGILDHPLEDRNTIEMTAITALAHIQSTVMFFVDISETCGWSIEQQVALFHSIKPLFKGKPLLIVMNKTDIRKVEEVDEADRKLIEGMKEGLDDVHILATSCAMKEGIDSARNQACELLLSKRVETKISQNKVDPIANRIFMTKTAAPANRPPCIPPGVIQKKACIAEGLPIPEELLPGVLEKELEQKNGGAGVHVFDIRKYFQLKNPEWKYDAVPEIMDGRNVADFVDPDVEMRLMELEKEEELLLAASQLTAEEIEEEARHQALQADLAKLAVKKAGKRMESRLKANNAMTKTQKTGGRRFDAEDIVEGLAERGTPLAVIEEVIKKRSKLASKARGRSRSRAARGDEDERPIFNTSGQQVSQNSRGAGSRSASARDASSRNPSRLDRSLSTAAVREKAGKAMKRATKKLRKNACKGESDRHIPDLKPKHLFSGKLGRGKRDRR